MKPCTESEIKFADGQKAPPAGQQAIAVDAMLASRQAQICSADMAAVRGRLTPEQSKRCSDQTINQFLRATVSNIDQAVKRLQETLDWRQEADVEHITCTACLADPRAHYMHPVGFDRLGRPVLYSCLQLAANRSVEDNRRHMIATFEQAIRLMRPPVEQWVWVSDFHGFGFSDLNPRIADTFLDLSAKHYPERLGAFLVIGAPFIFNGLWSVVQPLVDAATRKKIHMLSYDVGSAPSALEAALIDFFPADLAQWLLKEMAQNRDRSLESKKMYPFTSPGTAASGTVVDGHDVRGPASMLAALQLEP